MKTSALKICLIAAFAAMLTCGKFVLSTIANVEIVSILIGVFSYVFGFIALPSVLIFCAVESLIYGMGLWLVSYFIYWPLLSLVFVFLGKIKAKWWTAIPVIFVLTLFFGVLTSLVDVGLFSGTYQNFWQRFAIMYMQGVGFFAVHVVSNTIIFSAGFYPMIKVCLKMKEKMFANEQG